MKRKTEISFMIALLMVITTFSAVSSPAKEPEGPNPGEIIFIKEVWDDNMWYYETYAKVGEIVNFKISLTYNKDSQNPYLWALHHIIINDTLPECLEFAGNVIINTPRPLTEPYTQEITGKKIIWIFSDYDPMLYHEETMTIEFDARVIESEEDENENIAEVYANECDIYDHREKSSAWVYVEEEPGDESSFEKKVWEPELEEWVNELPGVQMCEPVKFQLTLTYYGENTMKYLVVYDELPANCLEYQYTSMIKIAGEVITENDPKYPVIIQGEGATIEICGEVYEIPENKVIWDWRNADFNLHDGEIVIIEFYADVINYCNYEAYNSAGVYLWTCDPCYDCFHAEDYVSIYCYPPYPIFDKKVWNGQEWIEKTSTHVGDTVRFRIELTYWGNGILANISIYDELPCCLEYANNADPDATNVSSDLKRIWWNLSKVLEDCETLYIEFDALVIGATGCDCNGINIAEVNANEVCGSESNYYDEDTASITATYRPCPPAIYGSESGKVKEELTFFILGNDPDGDNLYYWIDWGNEEGGVWIGPFASGEEVEVSHSWNSKGTYNIRAKSKDTNDEESKWGNTIAVKITGSGDPEIDIKITIYRFSWRTVKLDIRNTGDKDISKLDWEVDVNFGVLGRLNDGDSDKIEVFKVDDHEHISIKCRRMLSKIFNKVKVEVMVTADGEKFVETFNGRIIVGGILFFRQR